MDEREGLLAELAALCGGNAVRSVYRGVSAARLRQALSAAREAEAARRRFGGRMAAMAWLDRDYMPEVIEDDTRTP